MQPTAAGPPPPRRHRHGPRWWREFRLWFHRRRSVIRSNPHSRFAYRLILGLLGIGIVLLGLVLVPLPGPGWLIVFIGFTVLASEFAFAKRILHRGRLLLTAWSHWLRRQHLGLRIALSASTALFVCAVVYLLLRFTGLPSWVPSRLVPGWLGF